MNRSSGRVGTICVPLLVSILVAACGGNGGGSLQALLDRPGTDVAVTAGTSSYVPGPIRISFSVIRPNGQAVERPTARVWIATGLDEEPYAQGVASLEPIGVPGVSEEPAGHVTSLYVAHLRAPKPGKYWLLAEPVGASRAVQALGNVIVSAESSEPAVGAKAIPSETPTIRSERGNLAKLTTATPPDTALLRYSIAEAVRARVPFVVTFSTPKFCTSRTCGPVVDVVDTVRRRFARSPVRFIHVEIYRDNDPGAGYNKWVKEWRLPTEPWTFVVGRDGRVKAKFEGSISPAELSQAVRRHVL